MFKYIGYLYFICENSLFQDIFPLQDLILLKIYVNANIINMLIFNKMKMDPQGHLRSYEVTFIINLFFHNSFV